VLRIDGKGYSPVVMWKLLKTAGEITAFERGAEYATDVAEVPISGKHLAALAHEFGTELADVRDARVEAHRLRQLEPEPGRPPVDIACVEVDGGRLKTRATGHGRGVFGHGWKEPKYGCLWRMTGETFAEDPHPRPPACFGDPPTVRRLVKQLKGRGGGGRDEEPEPTTAPREEDLPPRLRWKPERLVRTCVATMHDVHAFGPIVAAEAQRRGFYHARRQVFLADGGHSNWTVHRLHFPHFTAIVDFTHVVEYLYDAATAVTIDTPAAQWEPYETWMTACWQGRVAEVIDELDQWQRRLGDPPEDAPHDDPREVVRRTRGYLDNNRERMHYPRYRREGLPVTSALVESLIKEFNKRVKGSEKFWKHPDHAESILQLKAALLSDGDPLRKHLANRPGNPFVRRRSPAKEICMR
jgi:hypothetical protein